MICIKRVYEPFAPESGRRFLVDRLWPRGIRKDALDIAGWLKEAAPSDALRKWFGHDASRWDEFCKRYFVELDAHPDAWRPLLEAAREADVTLLFGPRDVRYNNAAALKIYLDERWKSR